MNSPHDSKKILPEFDAVQTKVQDVTALTLKQPDPPVRQRRPFLLLSEATGYGQWYSVTLPETTIGRGRVSTIQINSFTISRQHARITSSASGDFYIEDLNSTNGTYVNGERVAFKPLQSGDVIHLGEEVKLTFELKDEHDVSLYKGLYESATRDPLTGVYNRLLFAELTEREMAFARRYRTHFCVVFLDIDHFKNLNDSYGHTFGDDVLRAVVRQVSEHVRSSDILARLGGEEFIMLIRNARAAEASLFAEKIRRRIDALPFETDSNVSVRVTASLGVVEYDPERHHSLRTLLEAVDHRMYKAKSLGRNRTVVDDQGHTENRSFPRYPCKMVVNVPGSSHEYSFTTIDLSIGGVGVELSQREAEHFKVGTDVNLFFKNEVLSLECLGKVVRMQAGSPGLSQLGIQFDALTEFQAEEIRRAIGSIKALDAEAPTRPPVE